MKSNIAPCIVAVTLVAGPASGLAQDRSLTSDQDRDDRFEVTSMTFNNNDTLALSMVYDQCSDHPGGANQSPELSWSNAPRHTASFVVVAYDVTASFTQWGMYNIARTTTELPENAGTVATPYGLQVSNDYGNLKYDGPCPPLQFRPQTHHYVFTVYALDAALALPSFGDFAPGAEALLEALIRAEGEGHVLASTSIRGFFPARP